jgi:ABC-2 type transport system permease protein
MRNGTAVWLMAKREVRAQRGSFLAWLVPLAAMVALVAAIQPSVASQNGVLAAKLAAMPASMKAAFGLGDLDFSRAPGYLATNFLIITLGATLFAGMLGASVVSREHAQKTAESVLTLPVERWQVLVGKTLGALSLFLMFHLTLVGTAVGVLTQVMSGEVEAPVLVSMFAGNAALGLVFFTFGLAIGTVAEARAAPSVAMGAVLGLYFVGMVSRVNPTVSGLAHLSPYSLVEPADIARQGGLAGQAAWLVVLAGIAWGAALYIHQRKDVHS